MDTDRTVWLVPPGPGSRSRARLTTAPSSFAILDRFVEAGGVTFDTANCYAVWADGGDGSESETLLGEWLHSAGYREQVTLATKLGAGPADPTRPYDAHNREGLSAEVIEREVATSLRRLRTDRIDLLYAHADDRTTPLEETITALDAQVASGAVGMLAASDYTTWRLAMARELARQQAMPASPRSSCATPTSTRVRFGAR